MIIPGLSPRIRVASAKPNQPDEEIELDLSPDEVASLTGQKRPEPPPLLEQLSELLAPKERKLDLMG